MDAATSIRDARRRAGLSQTELARRAGTSQATISAYERGRKDPSVETLGRLLAASGARLTVAPAATPVVRPSAAQLARAGRTLVDVNAVGGGAADAPRAHAALPAAGGGRDPPRARVTLPERLVAIHRALARRRIPHAFGGAIALAYWTLDPRATSDFYFNIFVPAAECERALPALPAEVAQPDGVAETIARDGQIRLWWDETPVDLFFDFVPLHEAAARHRRTVPFARTRIPVLGPIELAVFKATSDRTRDWADIEAMLAAETLDLDAVRETLQTMLPGDDPRFARLEEALRRAKADAGG